MRYYCGKALDEDKVVEVEEVKKETHSFHVLKKIMLFPFTVMGLIFHELFNKYIEHE